MINAEQKKMIEDEDTVWSTDVLIYLGLKRAEINKLRDLVSRRTRYHFRDRMKEVTIGTEGDLMQSTTVCTGQEFIVERLIDMPNGKDKRRAFFSGMKEISVDEADQYPTVDTSQHCRVLKNIADIFENSYHGVSLRQFDKVAIASYVNRIVDYRNNKFLRPTLSRRMRELNMGEGTPVVHYQSAWETPTVNIFHPVQEEE